MLCCGANDLSECASSGLVGAAVDAGSWGATVAVRRVAMSMYGEEEIACFWPDWCGFVAGEAAATAPGREIREKIAYTYATYGWCGAIPFGDFSLLPLRFSSFWKVRLLAVRAVRFCCEKSRYL